MGVVQSVTIASQGATSSRPSGTKDKLEPYTIKAGRIRLTLQQVRREEMKIERQYTAADEPPPAVVDHYRALSNRDQRLRCRLQG